MAVTREPSADVLSVASRASSCRDHDLLRVAHNALLLACSRSNIINDFLKSGSRRPQWKWVSASGSTVLGFAVHVSCLVLYLDLQS